VEEDLPDTSHIWSNKEEITGMEKTHHWMRRKALRTTCQESNTKTQSKKRTSTTTLKEWWTAPSSQKRRPHSAAAPQPSSHAAHSPGKPEGRYLDKLRTIHDATVNKVNDWIRKYHQHLYDLLTVLHAERGDLTPLKFDVTKAHRRIRIQRKDWKYITAVTKSNVWVNKVGTYGVASAGADWPRFCYASCTTPFPAKRWAFVYVDDHMNVIPNDRHLAHTIVTFMHSLGLPLSSRTFVNFWSGYMVNIPVVNAGLTPEKQQTMHQLLLHLESEAQHTLSQDEIYVGAGSTGPPCSALPSAPFSIASLPG
jgi:hypothetical protein